MGRALKETGITNVKRLNYNMAEAAVALGVGKTTVQILAADGRLPAVRLGGRLLFPIAALEQMITASANDGPKPKLAANIEAAAKKKLARELAKLHAAERQAA